MLELVHHCSGDAPYSGYESCRIGRVLSFWMDGWMDGYTQSEYHEQISYVFRSYCANRIAIQT